MQRFERYFALERKIACAPHRSKRAASEWRKNLVIVANRPAHSRLRRFARRSVGLATNHHDAARRIPSIDRTQQHRERWETFVRVDGKSAIESARDHSGSLRSQPLHRRNLAGGGRFPGERRIAKSSELPLITGSGRDPLAAFPLGRLRQLRSDNSWCVECPNFDRAMTRPHSAGNRLPRNRPLPLEHPEPARRGDPERVAVESAVRDATIVQIRERGARTAQQLEHVRNVRGTEPGEPRANSFACHPPAKISW